MWSEGIGRAEEEIPRQEETLEPRQGPSARGGASRLLDWYEETRRGTKPTIVKHPELWSGWYPALIEVLWRTTC